MIVGAIALSLLPFVVIEWAVRTFADPPAAVDVHSVVGLDHLQPLFELDPASDRYRIPDWRLQFFCRDSFPRVKSAGTRRVFVLGGSTVQGRPFSTETAFSTWLRLQLQAADPNTNFEVINCGGVSYASYRVAKILDEVLAYQPDAIVIYTGHNEFLEDRSYEHIRQLGPIRRSITRATSSWATARWIQRKLMPPEIRAPMILATEVDTRLDHIGGLDSYQNDPTWRSEVESQFSQSFSGMLSAAKAAKVPVIVCSPSSDLVNTPPFKSDPTVARFDASLTYAAGRAKWEAGEVAEAKRLLVLAKNQDICPLRATDAIVQSVHDACRDFETPMIDTDELFDMRNHLGAKVSDGIADPEFFADHVHPTIAGHQRIAAALLEKFTNKGWVTISSSSQARFEAAAASHLSSLDETYYARGRQRLRGLRRWASGRAALPIAEDQKSLE
ncbi:GDSL-like Lipase/Acylhydrolase [Rubripirellula reticaptiva]|uniref:GDSL-like Lipase/Acylhydrolase n=2 Tax=Rubripirellula reticaptiva TaxID=2528013 RepID=A0A5C6EIF0_9BACT|nr:GDSL-like Lipase/Acylhydrolase [Rubripirellula reticaptiva]